MKGIEPIASDPEAQGCTPVPSPNKHAITHALAVCCLLRQVTAEFGDRSFLCRYGAC